MSEGKVVPAETSSAMHLLIAGDAALSRRIIEHILTWRGGDRITFAEDSRRDGTKKPREPVEVRAADVVQNGGGGGS
jgi:hypothetical protein